VRVFERWEGYLQKARKFRELSEVSPNNFVFINKGQFGIFTKFRGIKVFYTPFDLIAKS
jgi:hypothetical protein